MRASFLIMAAIALVAGCAPTMTPAEIEERQALPLAFGSLGWFRPGDSFIYKLRFPATGFLGNPAPIAAYPLVRPVKPQDYETKFVRLLVTGASLREDERRVSLRLDEVDEERRLLHKALYDVELVRRAKEVESRFFRAAVIVLSRNVVIHGVPFPFMNYPPIQKAVPGTGKKVFKLNEAWRELVEWQVHTAQDGVSRTVEVRRYRLLSDEEAKNEKRSLFFDAEANQVLSQPPEEARRLLPVGLREEETQTWDVGMPFWKEMIRRDGRGTFLMECELLGHERAGSYTPLQ